MKLSPTLSIDSIDYASQGNAILGIRNSGKSYTATFIAERLMDDGIPFIAFDPIGIWRYLKVGKKGAGYPVVVAGDNGDLPLTPQSAVDIVRAAMKENISLVVDLYSMNLSKADWRKIVEQSIRLLLYENKPCGLRHIFIEEASEFIPQRVQSEDGKVYAEMEKLARMGGNASLGYTLINQRAEEVNKAVLELCDCLFLHRQKGRHSLTALGKWLDVADTKNAKAIINSLPSLEQGECWVWQQGSHDPERIKMPQKKTVHPDRKNPLATSAGVPSDVSKFVARMNQSLSATPAEAGPAKKLPRMIDQSDEVVHLKKVVEDRDKTIRILQEQVEQQNSIIFDIKVLINASRLGNNTQQAIPEMKIRSDRGELQPALRKTISQDQDKIDLPSGEVKILIACAQYPNGLNRQQLSTITAFAKSTRDRYIQYLREKGMVEIAEGKVIPTEQGKRKLGTDFKPLPTGKALQEYWLNILPEGEARILALLIRQYPKMVSREDVGRNTEYAKSTRDRYIQYMVAKEIVKTKDRGMVIASENLFN